MSWRDLEGKRIEQVRTVDRQQVVLQLEGGEVVQIRAQAAPTTSEATAELRVEVQQAAPPAGAGAAAQPGMVKDPVCQMLIEPAHAAATYEYEGKTYYFCAVGCKSEFEKDPARYVAA